MSGKVSRPAASTPQQTQPQPQKARQFVQTQPVKRTSLRPAVSTDLTRSSSMGFLNQVKMGLPILFFYHLCLQRAHWRSHFLFLGQRFGQRAETTSVERFWFDQFDPLQSWESNCRFRRIQIAFVRIHFSSLVNTVSHAAHHQLSQQSCRHVWQ